MFQSWIIALPKDSDLFSFAAFNNACRKKYLFKVAQFFLQHEKTLKHLYSSGFDVLKN
jgi:hypothetical protein